MKKLLLIILTLAISGCFHDPKEKALKNCADTNFAEKHNTSYYFINKNTLLEKKVEEWRKKTSLDSNVRGSRIQLKKATETLLDFSYKNFSLSRRELENILDNSFFKKNNMGFSKEVMALLEYPHDPEEVVKKIKRGTEEQKNQFKKMVENYNVKRAQVKATEKGRSEHTTRLFLKLKMQEKFLEKRYVKEYEKCERTSNELPSSFINKWK